MARYYKSTSTVWNSAASWSATSSAGVDSAGVPTASDDVIFEVGSGAACSVNVSAVCKSLDFTAWTGSIAMTNGITCSGNVTLGSSMAITGTGVLTVNAAANLTSNGKTWGTGLTLSNNNTKVLIDDFRVAGNVITSGTLVLNGVGLSLICNANLTIGSTTGVGTATFVCGGTGVYSHSASVQMKNNLTFNSSGTVTVSGDITFGQSGLTVKHIAGTIVTTGSRILIVNGTAFTFDTSGMTWNDFFLQVSGNMAFTLTSNLNISGQCDLQAGSTITWSGAGLFNPTGTLKPGTITTTFPGDLNITTLAPTGTATLNGNSIYISGNLTLSTFTVTGTTNIRINGTGAWTGTGQLKTNLIINTAGTFTLSGSISYNTGTLTYTAGTVVNTSSTLTVAASTTFNTSGMSFNNITVSTTATLTINSLLSLAGTLLLSAATTFIGTAGFSATILSCTTAGLTHSLKAGNTYSVVSSLVLTGTNASRIGLISGTSSSYAFFNLLYGSLMSVSFVDATDIDSSGGRTIFDYKGTLLRTINWSLLTAPGSSAKTFFD